MSFEKIPVCISAGLKPPYHTIQLFYSSMKVIDTPKRAVWLDISAKQSTLEVSPALPGSYFLTSISITTDDGLSRCFPLRLAFPDSGKLNLPVAFKNCARAAAIGSQVNFELRKWIPAPSRTFESTSALVSIDNYSPNDVLFLFPHPTLPPRQLWANSNTLRAISSYYETMFTSSFMESEMTYAMKNLPDELFALERTAAKVDAGVEETTEDASKEIVKRGATVLEHTEERDVDSDDDNDELKESIHTQPLPIRRVIVKSASYKTFRALLFYISTSQISFSPLSSLFSDLEDPVPHLEPLAITHQSLTLPAPVSPKSIYKLAHKLDIQPLCQLALASFSLQLSEKNALEELFSEASICYEEIKEAAMMNCLTHWAALKADKQIEALEGELARGELRPERMALAFELFKKFQS